MAPIRVGFIGLSKSGWAPAAHLPYLKASSEYEIVALCNSTVQSAEEAIKLYELPATTKAYGDPEELAKDPNVDLVVCSVRVDRHLQTISPSLKAGKDVLVEWPLGKSAAEAKELLKLKNEGGVKLAVVDLQARRAPVIAKIKEIIDSGRIGKVLSSTWSGAALHGGPTTTKGYEYMGQKKVGGNLVTIHSGHAWDYIQHVLGYGFTKVSSVLANRRTSQKLVSATGEVLNPSLPKTADDTIFVIGTLSSGVPLSFTLRGGLTFKGTPGLDWRIYGEAGEIRITASGPFIQIGYPDTKIEVHDHEADTVEVVTVEAEKEIDDIGGLASQNVSRVYRGIAKGETTCSFEDAVERHEFIEGLYKENGYTEV